MCITLKMSKSGNFHNSQDWEPVVLKKTNTQTQAEKKRSGQISSVRTSEKPNSNQASVNSRKLEQNETPLIATIPHDLKIQIQQARTAKKMTQKELATKLNSQQNLIQNYENGTAVPDGAFLAKMSKVLGVQLKNPKKKVKKTTD